MNEVKEITGFVSEREIHLGDEEFIYITDVGNAKEKLSNLLDEFIGENVKITIEKI